MTTETPWPLSRLRVSGDDAHAFLQGQLTCDVDDLDEDSLHLAAWCNPKGRVITIFRARRRDQAVELFLPAELAETVVARLKMFRFRSKVDFDLDEANAGDMGSELSADAWLRQELENGVAFVGEAQSEKYTPHMLNLDLLDAVSFDKGCYTGQEVVARTHYRGATKRRMRKFESERALAVGDRISDGERDIGEVLNVAGTRSLAVVSGEPAGQSLSAGGQPLRYIALPYLPG